jgi:hypothetical protein
VSFRIGHCNLEDGGRTFETVCSILVVRPLFMSFGNPSQVVCYLLIGVVTDELVRGNNGTIEVLSSYSPGGKKVKIFLLKAVQAP